MSNNDIDIKLPRRGKSREQDLTVFAATLQKIQQDVGFRISARGWCYQLEQFGVITKGEFDKVEGVINECRQKGYLPIDFTAEEED